MRISFVDWNISAATDLYIDQWLQRMAAFLFAARYKRTEYKPSQFGSSRERIAAANAENPQCNTTENVERAASKDPPLTV